jgi:hypothetical protein
MVKKMADFGVLVVLLNLVDVLLGTLLLLKSKWTLKSWQNATADLKFCTCTIDLWFIAISRFALIIGAVFGVRLNPIQGRARLRLSRRPIFLLSFGGILRLLNVPVTPPYRKKMLGKIIIFYYYTSICAQHHPR